MAVPNAAIPAPSLPKTNRPAITPERANRAAHDLSSHQILFSSEAIIFAIGTMTLLFSFVNERAQRSFSAFFCCEERIFKSPFIHWITIFFSEELSFASITLATWRI